jgi:hypothetical protein
MTAVCTEDRALSMSAGVAIVARGALHFTGVDDGVGVGGAAAGLAVSRFGGDAGVRQS